MKDRIFYAICLGFLGGTLLRSFVFINIDIVYSLGLLAFFLLILFSLFVKSKRACLRRQGVLISVLMLTFTLGVFRFHIADDPNPEYFESKVGEKIAFEGFVVAEPDIREDNQKITVETSFGEESTKILLTVPLGEPIKYGDEISFGGKLAKPENFMTDTGKEFDYINYLRKDGILYLVNYGDVEILSSGHGNKIKTFLFKIKANFLEIINFSIADPESLLMGGLILGEKSPFSQELRQSFVDTGTIHIVALSGYNVTIIAEWIMKLFVFLPYSFGIGMGIFAILLFVLMTGAGSTAVRAGVMAVLALIARATGRDYDVARGLILAGVIMILLNPFVLVHDVSFQLSFIATVAVIFLAPRIEKYFLWVTEKGKLRDIVSVTCAAYIFVLPFILYKMGNLSLVALPANVLILPFIPFTMGLGFIVGVMGMIWYVLAIPFSYLAYLFLHYELSVVHFFAEFSYASLSIPNFPLWLVLLIYGYFFYLLFWRSIKSAQK